MQSKHKVEISNFDNFFVFVPIQENTIHIAVSPRRRRPRQYKVHPLLEKRTKNNKGRSLRKLMPVR